jgi:hypothetical protein
VEEITNLSIRIIVDVVRIYYLNIHINMRMIIKIYEEDYEIMNELDRYFGHHSIRQLG